MSCFLKLAAYTFLALMGVTASRAGVGTATKISIVRKTKHLHGDDVCVLSNA